MNRADIFETEMGFVAVVANGANQLLRCSLPEPQYEDAFRSVQPEVEEAETDSAGLGEIRELLQAYLRGENVSLSEIEVDTESAAPFFRAVWARCRTIPFGEVRTYAWLARMAGSPLAIRAAGQAMARNRIAIVIPCHRVIGSSGDLQGFGGTRGVALKRELLRREGVRLASARDGLSALTRVG